MFKISQSHFLYQHVSDLHLDDLFRTKAVSGCGAQCIDPASQEIAPHPHTETLTMDDGEPVQIIYN